MERRTRALVAAGWLLLTSGTLAEPQSNSCPEHVAVTMQVGAGHPWTPPFGVDRVGRPPTVRVRFDGDDAPRGEYEVVAYGERRPIERHPLTLMRGQGGDGAASSSSYADVRLSTFPSAVALQVRCSRTEPPRELVRQLTKWPDIEADVEARASARINPVDLGTILVPHDWLLLTAGQSAVLDVAAVSRMPGAREARLIAWFDSAKAAESGIRLTRNTVARKTLEVPFASTTGDSTILHVRLADGERELWRKDIRTMVVAQPPARPTFGAIETKLRYDAPILVTQPDGSHSFLDYDTAWDPRLKDVVVFLPGGARFVFWRGASFGPFWAGRGNTGLSYEFAETMPPRDSGVKTSIEPLNDKALRFGRVEIVESTSSRVHVRWTYQPTDLGYSVFGDGVVEEYIFYPDGFGTRVVTLTASPGADYELSELILITPQAAFPLEVTPRKAVELLALDGTKRSVMLPYEPEPGEEIDSEVLVNLRHPQNVPMLYRVRLGTDDTDAAIYFSPQDKPVALQAYLPFRDQGEVVTPAYWGSHWPLARGNPGRFSIDPDIHSTPTHVSLLVWRLPSALGNRPEPISSGEQETLDALGRARRMQTRRWAWLIGHTDASDDALIRWAQSYSAPPSIELAGARVDFPSYAQERRAIRLVAERPSIDIQLEPATYTVNPVFEIDDAPEELVSVAIDGRTLSADAYAWDGKTLWLQASIDSAGARLSLQFKRGSPPRFGSGSGPRFDDSP